MASERNIKIYSYTAGATCTLLFLAATIIIKFESFTLSDVQLFILLIIIEATIDKFRIYTGRVWISFAPIIELSSFLALGIVASAWIQFIFLIAIDYLIYKKPIRTVSLNIGMIVGKMFVGALAYNLVLQIMGGTVDRYFSFNMIIAAAAFMLFAFVYNQIFIILYFKFTNGERLRQLISAILWEGIVIIVSIPVALEFTDIYKFSSEKNLWFAILFILPVIFSCFIFSLVRRIMFANTQLKAISKVALTINCYLNLEQTYNSVLDAISSLTVFKGCYIFDMDESGQNMIPVAYKIDDNIDSSKVYSFNIKDSILGKVAGSTKAIIFNDLQKESSSHKESEYCGMFRSCILVPMRRLNKCVGCICIFSDQERAYNTDILEFLMILSDQATVAIENAKLFKLSEEEAITDSLTYLYNQKYFYNYIDRKIKETAGGSDKISLILFDIDHFKKVNDTYGHVVGDHVLREVAHLIKASVRKNDIVARYGGEEFTAILPDLDSEGAYLIAERIRDRIEKHLFIVDGIEIKVTVSGGISEYPKVAANAIELVSYADRAMYVGAKFKGRNKVKVYDEKLA